MDGREPETEALRLAVADVVRAYVLGTRLALPRDRLERFAERLSLAGEAVAEAFPDVDRTLRRAQERPDGPEAREVAAAFAAVGWTGPAWPDPPRLASDAADPGDAAALALAHRAALDVWADHAWRVRNGHLGAPEGGGATP